MRGMVQYLKCHVLCASYSKPSENHIQVVKRCQVTKISKRVQGMPRNLSSSCFLLEISGINNLLFPLNATEEHFFEKRVPYHSLSAIFIFCGIVRTAELQAFHERVAICCGAPSARKAPYRSWTP